MELAWPEQPPWTVNLSGTLGRFEGVGDSLFSALIPVRRSLESSGWLLNLNAARVDAWPSRMALDAGGSRLYLLSMGQPGRLEDLVDALSPIENGRAGTVQEQKEFSERWMRSLQL